jgi:hypothetical protein
MVLSVKLRTFDSLLAPRSQTASSGSQRCSISTWRSACTDPWRAPGGWQQCWGAWQRQPLRRRQCATPDSLAAAVLARCCYAGHAASSHRVSSINQTQDQYPCPWLQPGRWGAAPHWVSAAFYHLSTILRVRGRISNPLVLHPTPPLIASERACLKPLHPDCMGCMSSR